MAFMISAALKWLILVILLHHQDHLLHRESENRCTKRNPQDTHWSLLARIAAAESAGCHFCVDQWAKTGNMFAAGQS
jgi:alkylhydroperoxidase family enzyme